jgi:hypothetical protein
MASNALFYFANLTEQGILTATSAATGFPVGNLQDRDKKTYTKPSTTAAQIYQLVLPSAMSSRACIIIHDNLYTLNYGLKVYGADDAAFTVNVIYAVGSAGAYLTPTPADQPVWYKRFTSILTKKYRRYEFSPLGTPSTDILVADIYDSPEIDTLRHPGGAWEYDCEDDTEVQECRGFTAATAGAGVRQKRSLNFEAIPVTLKDSILAGHEIVRTGFLPFWYIDEYGVLNLVRFAANPKASHHFGTLWDLSVQLRKEKW